METDPDPSGEFGGFLRAARERREMSLRRAAEEAGVEPGYLSRIERGLVPPPGEDAIRRLAGVLGEDPDVILALAGKVSSDLRRAILRRPALFATLIRQMNDMPDRALLRIVREVRDGDW